MNVKDAIAKLRTSPWIIACIIGALIAACLPIFPDGFGNKTTLIGWVISWLGACFKAVSGGVIGWFFIRHVLRLNISDLPEQYRPIAGLGAAILLAAFVHAITVGS